MSDEYVQTQTGMSMGGLSRVDGSLIPRSQVGTDVYQNPRQLRSPTDNVRGDSGSRKVVFSPPNSGLLNLREINFLCNFRLDATGMNNGQFPFIPKDGSIWKWDGSGSDPEPSMNPNTTTASVYTTNIRQGLSDPFYATIIERIVVSVGSTPIIDTRELNTLNHLNMKLRWNSTFLIPQTTTYQGYDADNSNRIPGVANSGYWEQQERLIPTPNTRYYQLSSAPEPIAIKPFFWENALINTSDGILPLTLMPNVTIEIYFAASDRVLQQALPVGYSYYAAGSGTQTLTGRVNYIIDNLRLECLMAGSASLETALMEQGMSMTFRNFAHYTRQITNVQGNLSFQIPVTQRAVEEVFIILREEAILNNITASGKYSAYWPTQRIIQSANIRINGIRRYGEDLDSRGMYLELIRLEPGAKMSELFQDPYRDWGADNQILIFSAKMDYSKDLLSGIKTASQTSPLIVDVQWTNNFNPSLVPLQMDIFVGYTSWLSINRQQIEVID